MENNMIMKTLDDVVKQINVLELQMRQLKTTAYELKQAAYDIQTGSKTTLWNSKYVDLLCECRTLDKVFTGEETEKQKELMHICRGYDVRDLPIATGSMACLYASDICTVDALIDYMKVQSIRKVDGIGPTYQTIIQTIIDEIFEMAGVVNNCIYHLGR